jgi:hypothetical protein
MEQKTYPTYIGIEKDIEAIKGKQDELRRPEGTLESLWKDSKTKVSWTLFIWVIAAIFAFTAIMQGLIYRSLDDTNRKMEKLNDLVINEIRGKK